MKLLNSEYPAPFGLKRLAVPIALAVVALGACTKKEEAPVVVRPVRSIVVERKDVRDPVVVTGHLRARDEVNLAFRISGRLLERKPSVGDMVEAGETVAFLDAEVERNARNAAQADLAAARAAVEQSEAFEGRQKRLLKSRVISENDYDLALRDLKTARARMDAAVAQLQSAEEQLSYTELKSDAAGVITQKGAEPGEVVAAGQMILKVAQQSGRDAVFSMPAQVIRDGLSLGQDVDVWLADTQDIKASGKIREVSPQADPVTRNYQIKVGLVDPPSGMFLGATVVGRLELKARSLIEIPASALTMIEGKPAVWVVDARDQRVHRREIAVARHAPEAVIVTEGLESGERVVTAGVQQLHEGQSVKLLGGEK